MTAGALFKNSALCLAERREISVATSSTELSRSESVIAFASKPMFLNVSVAIEVESVIWRVQSWKTNLRTPDGMSLKPETPSAKNVIAVSTSLIASRRPRSPHERNSEACRISAAAGAAHKNSMLARREIPAIVALVSNAAADCSSGKLASSRVNLRND